MMAGALRWFMRAYSTERASSPGAMTRAFIMPRVPRDGATSQAPIHMRDKAYDLLLSTLLSHNVPEVSIDRIASGSFRVLDARAYREFGVSHIEGATWVGYDDFDIGRLAGINKQATVAVYCSVGYRSERIAENYISRLYPCGQCL